MFYNNVLIAVPVDMDMDMDDEMDSKNTINFFESGLA